jgi:hypothetical protein
MTLLVQALTKTQFAIKKEATHARIHWPKPVKHPLKRLKKALNHPSTRPRKAQTLRKMPQISPLRYVLGLQPNKYGRKQLLN